MTTRADLVLHHAAAAVNQILENGRHEGGRPFVRIVEDEMHRLLRADDALEHQNARSLMSMIGPRIIKKR